MTTERMNFAPITLQDKARYEALLQRSGLRGCEYSFANLYLWGRQYVSFTDGHAVLFSQFNRRSVYPYPVGDGDKRSVLDRIIADAAARGIPCRITGLDEAARETIETLYPGRFRIHADEESFDYVYDVNDLADLNGKKYHGKRNHLARFAEEYPACTAEPLSAGHLDAVRRMTDLWYEKRLEENPHADHHMEKAALEKALRDYEAIGMEGLVLTNGGDVLALSLASRLSEDTFDIHFEKAPAEIRGAYAAINREMARYLRSKYPTIRFLNREEDMGIEGLRRAKRSYGPHHMVEKCWACLLEDGYDY